MDIKLIAEKINENGGRLYYVGGYVRDKLMGKKAKDIDFCITGLTPEIFSNLFPNAFLKGAFFPVFQLENYELAFARKETKIGIGHKGFFCNIKEVSIVDDLLRRDITINSIAIDVLTGEIIDPFNGQKDIERKTIRATSNHFVEDPLRIYRVAQFAARFNFNIESETKDLMRSMKNELKSLSAERVFEELKKALKSDTPSIFFNVLNELDLLDIHFKELKELIGAIQPIKYHPEGDSYVHSLIVLDNVAKMTKNEKIRFAGLLHDLGKGKTPKEILPHHYNHEQNGLQPTKDLCNRLKVPNSWKKLALVIVSEHMKAGFFDKMSIPKQVEFLEKNFDYLYELEIIARADSKNSELSFVELGKRMFAEVNGNTISLPQAKKAKNILHERRIVWLKNQN